MEGGEFDEETSTTHRDDKIHSLLRLQPSPASLRQLECRVDVSPDRVNTEMRTNKDASTIQCR